MAALAARAAPGAAARYAVTVARSRTTAIDGLPVPELQLATLVDRAPEGDDWLHEQKFDGYRIVADRQGAEVRLLSRRFKDWTAAFPSVAAAVAELPVARVVLDGEVCVFESDGRTSFQALQNARSAHDDRFTYVVFDLLALDGELLLDQPLEQRKATLQALIDRANRGRPAGEAVVRLSDHVVGRGAEMFQAACARRLEGIVSKRREAPYAPGRGLTWVKTKCIQRQEMVIGGWTDPERSREAIGALLLGYYDAAGKLCYAGKVGTGFTSRSLGEVRAALDAVAATRSAFDPAPPRAWTGPGVHWVAPSLVAEIAFSEWTNDGRLRHPSFKGLRTDKRARDVVREQPTTIAAPVARPAARTRAKPRRAT
jgi:bifunctional non-homologous end joining protein LigD